MEVAVCLRPQIIMSLPSPRTAGQHLIATGRPVEAVRGARPRAGFLCPRLSPEYIPGRGFSFSILTNADLPGEERRARPSFPDTQVTYRRQAVCWVTAVSGVSGRHAAGRELPNGASAGAAESPGMTSVCVFRTALTVCTSSPLCPTLASPLLDAGDGLTGWKRNEAPQARCGPVAARGVSLCTVDSVTGPAALRPGHRPSHLH